MFLALKSIKMRNFDADRVNHRPSERISSELMNGYRRNTHPIAMTRKELIDKLESVEREVKEIREYLSQNDGEQVAPVGFPLPLESDFMVGYTLEDLYKEFGKKKSLAYRLKSALKKRNIKTLEDFLSLTPGELLELEGVDYDTLLRTKKALSKLGIDW